MCEHCTRREFLGTGVAGGLLLADASSAFPRASESVKPDMSERVKICVIISGEPVPEDRDWGVGASQVNEMTARLKSLESRLNNTVLVIGHSTNEQQTEALLKQAGANAPVLAINVQNFALTRVVKPVLDGKHPMIIFSLPASGHDWMYAHRWQRAGHRVTLIPSSDYEDMERALRLLRTVEMMKQTRILLFPPARGTEAARSPVEIKNRLGAEVVAIDEDDFSAMIDSADDAAVKAEMDRWTQGAKQILEPNRDDIQKAARISIALQNLVQREQAQGLAIGTCMGWLNKGFPCLGFTRLRDHGIPAACEGDMDSLLTMILFQYAFDRPGFQGNATFDTSRNALWTAHCTAPLKMDGPDGEEAPYLLRGHSEVAGSGCVPEIQYRLGQTVTRAKMINLDTILASTGEIIEVPDVSVHGCRTQIVTKVRDAAKMAENWSRDIDTEDAMTLLHRVVVYGDHLDSVKHLSRLMGMNVIEEC